MKNLKGLAARLKSCLHTKLLKGELFSKLFRRAATEHRGMPPLFGLVPSRTHSSAYGWVGTGLYTQPSLGLMLFPFTKVTFPFAK